MGFWCFGRPIRRPDLAAFRNEEDSKQVLLVCWQAFLSNLLSSSSSATGCPAFVEPEEVVEVEDWRPFLRIGTSLAHLDRSLSFGFWASSLLSHTMKAAATMTKNISVTE